MYIKLNHRNPPIEPHPRPETMTRTLDYRSKAWSHRGELTGFYNDDDTNNKFLEPMFERNIWFQAAPIIKTIRICILR